MTDWLFPPAPIPSLPIAGRNERFPVRRILCVGQNYAAHAREMGHARAEPFFFTKPADAVVADGADPAFPSATDNLHHEVELVCAVGADGAIAGWAVGCDLTRRDLQAAAKDKGRPWDAAKGFDQSAPCGAVTLGPLPDSAAPIALSVNGETRQSGRLDDMVWNPEEILAKARELWDVRPGDLIFTGTPEGVGRLQPGDRIEASIGGLQTLAFTVRPR
ncbi:MAG: fumarylacetoacetate hydrolase family protein [Alphaproteobacteria bacterium]|uniref:fumarylacetoacetate hydrolase family protein n=1 Tax=Brevundimonas sp. TaxID=1871086 RepID=UPI0017A7E600|nr:fumarylacetoacetate hydrolase family protein [Brevundimonas sp.]MBU3970209.1 fumarylacetoacetate hydrolase family protein [Alphaproteobacteria bacterium]MBA3048610.1 fumarylacetoacetate hydrolase family protein [Brevundimonas sp.]MBU3973496.1 fumarylacetoacetate hydrolase family protein [Alphaproteobacteria bacterium]MBU4040975.1 fumarylacetoacetate hydrolase family protein [Alphaproteobacteria bacterium]MBU4138168.1 fumarylacetoacetate hydrolase family protein [Alphaproteobacteria bacteriu